MELSSIWKGMQVYGFFLETEGTVNFCEWYYLFDRLCGLVVLVLGYRSGGPGWIPGATRKEVLGLERHSISLVSTTEELLDRKVASPV
jgi:hypothetical protein